MGSTKATFTGLDFVNPFLLASAPPTESDKNIRRAFDAGWGGVVVKTIGLHPVQNVYGGKTIFQRASNNEPRLSAKKRKDSVIHSSWNWELISTKSLDWWVPRLESIKKDYPDRMLVASIMAGSGSDEELKNWQTLAIACQDAGCDALELNLSCPHMDRKDMGANLGRDQALISTVTQAVMDVATIPVWSKLTPSTTDITIEAAGAFNAGASAISSSNTFTALPQIDPDTLDFEINVDGLVSTGGLGGPAILPLSLAKMSALTQAFPDKEFSGIGGVSNFNEALNYFLLGCGTVQVCTAAMLNHAVGTDVIVELNKGLSDFIDKNADKGWTKLEDFVGLKRDSIVPQSQIRRAVPRGGPKAPTNG